MGFRDITKNVQARMSINDRSKVFHKIHSIHYGSSIFKYIFNPEDSKIFFLTLFTETTTKLGKLKLRVRSKSSYSEEEKERLDELAATSRLANFENLPRTRRTRTMDLIDQLDIQSPLTSTAPTSKALKMYHAHKKQNTSAQTNSQDSAEQTPYLNTQLGLSSIELTDLQKYQISLQRYGKYPPLLPRPKNHGGTSGASGSGHQY